MKEKGAKVLLESGRRGLYCFSPRLIDYYPQIFGRVRITTEFETPILGAEYPNTHLQEQAGNILTAELLRLHQFSLFWRPMQSIPVALLSLKLFKIATG